jgi:hypothetical protein
MMDWFGAGDSAADSESPAAIIFLGEETRTDSGAGIPGTGA